VEFLVVPNNLLDGFGYVGFRQVKFFEYRFGGVGGDRYSRVAELRRVRDRKLEGNVSIYAESREEGLDAGMVIKVSGDTDRYWSTDRHYLAKVLQELVNGTDFVVTYYVTDSNAGEVIEEFVEEGGEA